MSKKCKSKKINMGIIVMSVGAGLIIAVIIPIWGFILAIGGGLICAGWYLINLRK